MDFLRQEDRTCQWGGRKKKAPPELPPLGYSSFPRR
jgi:hypothetical protein